MFAYGIFWVLVYLFLAKYSWPAAIEPINTVCWVWGNCSIIFFNVQYKVNIIVLNGWPGTSGGAICQNPGVGGEGAKIAANFPKLSENDSKTEK